MKTKNLHDFYSWHCVRDEVVISGKDENGKDFTIVFDTIELLEWLDLPHMKDQAIKHIQEIGEPENPLKSRENFLKN
jgi:hypothetical protein